MSLTAPPSATQLPLIRGAEERRLAILRAKRRLFSISLLSILLVSAVSMVISLSGKGNYPSLWAYIATNVAVMGLGLGCLISLRHLENVKHVERICTLAGIAYLLYWDITALATSYMPSTEFLMTSVAEFLLAAALICLVVPRKKLTLALLSFFALHDMLTWANLLQFPWSKTHNAQLMSDLIMFVTTMCLTIIGTFQHMIATSHQETDVMQLLVNTDALTGLANRNSMLAQVQVVPGCAVLLLQLDHFDPAALGRSVTDAALVSVAQQLREAVAQNGSVGRWGEDQFMVLLPYATKYATQEVAERIRLLVANRGQPLPLTVSIGAATPRGASLDPQTLQRASEGLEVARREGGNRVVTVA